MDPSKAVILDNRTPNFTVQGTSFSPAVETKIIIHGFQEAEAEWMKAICAELLRMEICNVVTVDWGKGATIPYTRASTNTRVVGAEIAVLIEKLMNSTGASLDRFHLIGFSLGAHVAGYAGARLNGQVRRITGLDPAGPLFEGLPAVVRLDPTDGKFVDAIHTDAMSIFQLSFGSREPYGHIDFYPNGGHDQPGCPQDFSKKILAIEAVVIGLDNAGDEVACRHFRAHRLFLDSIRSNGCMLIGYPCDSQENFTKGLCASCGEDGTRCAVLGLKADGMKPMLDVNETNVKFFLNTGSNESFCLYHYQIVVVTDTMDPNDTVTIGRLNGTFMGMASVNVSFELTDRNMIFEQNTEYPLLVTSSVDLGIPTSVYLTYTPSNAFHKFFKFKSNVEDQIWIRRVQVTSLYRLMILKKTEETFAYCSTNSSLLTDGRTEKFGLGVDC